jgi:hypothetical protein
MEKGVPLGKDENGTTWWCTIRVERSILFRKGCYVVDVYQMAYRRCRNGSSDAAPARACGPFV